MFTWGKFNLFTEIALLDRKYFLLLVFSVDKSDSISFLYILRVKLLKFDINFEMVLLVMGEDNHTSIFKRIDGERDAGADCNHKDNQYQLNYSHNFQYLSSSVYISFKKSIVMLGGSSLSFKRINWIYNTSLINFINNRMYKHAVEKQNTPVGPISRACSFSLHASGQTSSVSNLFSRKVSTSSLKDYVDIDKIIGDIKITPAKNSSQQVIKTIFQSLQQLKINTTILDQIKTIELLLDSITKKLMSNALANTRTKPHTLQPERLSSNQKNNSISPIKLFDDATSRILYTNFNLKDFEQSRKQDDNMRTPAKKINIFEQEENQQMEKLNNEIHLLQKMLKMKGIGNQCATKCKANEQFPNSSKSKLNPNQSAYQKKVVPPFSNSTDTVPPKPAFIVMDKKTLRKGSQNNFR